MALRTCGVTCSEAQGVEHTVQVTAQSLFEAVAQALRVFRGHDWSCEPNSASASVVVTIKPAEVEHRVRIRFSDLVGVGAQEPSRNGAEAPIE
jgi:hypothetical protein